MTKQPLNQSIVPAQKVSGDLLSRLYREIGISAVAAALQLGDGEAETVRLPRRQPIPATALRAIR
jgi:hypothetical protein